MKRHLIIINLFLCLILSCIVSISGAQSQSFAAPTQGASTPVSSVELEPPIPQTIPQKNAYALDTATKQGGNNPFVKFFATMFGVMLSVGVIFAVLKLYKRVLLKNNQKIDTINYEKSLESPRDFKEAINLFLDKTDKE